MKKCEEASQKAKAEINGLEQPKAVGNDHCNPCAFTISYMFAKYEKHVEMTLETIFRSMSEKIAAALLQAKKDASLSQVSGGTTFMPK